MSSSVLILALVSREREAMIFFSFLKEGTLSRKEKDDYLLFPGRKKISFGFFGTFCWRKKQDKLFSFLVEWIQVPSSWNESKYFFSFINGSGLCLFSWNVLKIRQLKEEKFVFGVLIGMELNIWLNFGTELFQNPCLDSLLPF